MKLRVLLQTRLWWKLQYDFLLLGITPPFYQVSHYTKYEIALVLE